MRRLPLFSGSGVGRVISCTASAVLPQSDDDRGDTTARDAGTTVHGFIYRAAHVGRDAALAEIPLDAPGRAMCEGLDLDALPVDLMNADLEIALAYDIEARTARRLVDADGNAITDRRYADAVPPLGPYEIPTTLDALEIVGCGDGVFVTDWKSGQPHAGYREQIVFGALVARALLGTTLHWGRLVYLRGGSVDEFAITNDELDYLADSLMVTVGNAERMRGRTITRDDVSPGDHCRYCRAKDACPEYVSGAGEIATMQPSALASFRDLIRTDAGKVEAWKRLPVIEELVASMRAELDAAVIASPVDLPDGSTLGAVRTERRRVTDANAVRQVLAETCGEEAALAAVEVSYSTSIGAIEKAAGKSKRGVIERLEGLGAIQTATTVRAGVSRAKKGRAA